MRIDYYQRLTDRMLLDQIWELVCAYNDAFVPPLSARENSYQSNLADRGMENAQPVFYFEALKEQSFLLAVNNHQVAGFMSFKNHYESQDLNDGVQTTYVTTIIVDKAYRGRGLTRTF